MEWIGIYSDEAIVQRAHFRWCLDATQLTPNINHLLGDSHIAGWRWEEGITIDWDRFFNVLRILHQLATST